MKSSKFLLNLTKINFDYSFNTNQGKIISKNFKKWNSVWLKMKP